jgi:hypothetical protein
MVRNWEKLRREAARQPNMKLSELCYGILALPSAVVMIFIPALIVFNQCLTWLETAKWPWMPIRDYVAVPRTGLLGLNIILEKLGGLPLPVGIFLIGGAGFLFAIWFGFGVVGGWEERRLKKQRELQRNEYQ